MFNSTQGFLEFPGISPHDFDLWQECLIISSSQAGSWTGPLKKFPAIHKGELRSPVRAEFSFLEWRSFLKQWGPGDGWKNSAFFCFVLFCLAVDESLFQNSFLCPDFVSPQFFLFYHLPQCSGIWNCLIIKTEFVCMMRIKTVPLFSYLQGYTWRLTNILFIHLHKLIYTPEVSVAAYKCLSFPGLMYGMLSV